VSSMHVLVGARLFTGDALLDGHGVVIAEGRIVDLVPEVALPLPGGAAVTRLPEGSLLAPGFIDAQANGAGGVLFNADLTEATVLKMASALRRFGGTGVLPTLITDNRALMRPAAEAVIAVAQRPENGILGIHFEGPFISPQESGVHDPRYIRKPDEEDLEFLCVLPSRIPQGRVLRADLLSRRTGLTRLHPSLQCHAATDRAATRPDHGGPDHAGNMVRHHR
jgi:N-acetylglucosamine-6-phosphate deacetylase